MSGFPPPPQRHWRSYGTEPLPPAQEALNQPFRAFPSWFLRIECDRCGKATMLNEAHTGQRRGSLPLRSSLPECAMTAAVAGRARWSC